MKILNEKDTLKNKINRIEKVLIKKGYSKNYYLTISNDNNIIKIDKMSFIIRNIFEKLEKLTEFEFNTFLNSMEMVENPIVSTIESYCHLITQEIVTDPYLMAKENKRVVAKMVKIQVQNGIVNLWLDSINELKKAMDLLDIKTIAK